MNPSAITRRCRRLGGSLSDGVTTRRDVDRIGPIPDSAKTDALTGVNRFVQDRIVTSAAWVPGLPPISEIDVQGTPS